MSPLAVHITNLPKDYNHVRHGHHYFGRIKAEERCEVTYGPVVDIWHGPTLDSRSMTLVVAKRNEKQFVAKLKSLLVIGDDYNEKRQIFADVEFLGLIPLASHENPEIDVYFIHGIGGHALGSWIADPPANEPSAAKCWPRDFLPTFLNAHGISARISTLGYNAKVIGRADISADLNTFGENLLSRLRSSRDPDSPESQRPMYFICHSLGGLVLCKALNMILLENYYHPSIAEDLRNLFITQDANGQDQCFVKGMMFLGTPFHGSLRADQLSGILRGLAQVNPFGSTAMPVQQLRQNSFGDLDQISASTRTLVERYGIQLRVGYETRPWRNFGQAPVTTRESALGGFAGITIPMKINKDHSEMVKYQHEHDNDYIVVSNNLTQMIQSTHTRSDAPAAASQFASAPRRLPPGPRDDDDSEPGHEPSPESSSLRQHTFPVQRHYHYHMEGNGNRPFTPPEHPTGTGASHPATPPSAQNLRPTFNPLDRSPPIVEEPTHQHQVQEAISDLEKLRQLGRFDTVLVIDDTGSMQLNADIRDTTSRRRRWDLLCNSVSQLVEPVTTWDSDGIDIYFLKNPSQNEQNVRDPGRILRKLQNIDIYSSQGPTELDPSILMAVAPKISEYREFQNKYQQGIRANRPKPLNVIVITDGNADDSDYLEEDIKMWAEELDQLKAPQNYIGIQFVQIGDDPVAARWLARLDDDLKKDPRVKGRDMIDTTPYDSQDHNGLSDEDFGKLMEKTLLGAVIKDLDNRSNREFQSIPDERSLEQRAELPVQRQPTR